jgi:hypothetical protein
MTEVNFLVKKGLTVPKGSAATPAVIFDASDPNTGIYSPGADQVAISTNGTGRLFVDASGNVGIGRAPSTKLHITGPNNTLTFDRYGNGWQTAAIGPEDAGGSGILKFYTNSTGTVGVAPTERMRLDGLGRLGLGTSSPGALLDVSSQTGTASPTPTQIRITSASSGEDWSTTSPWGRIAYYLIDTSTSASGPKTHASIDSVCDLANGSRSSLTFSTLQASNSNTLVERVRITSTGNVGIGTTSPSASALLDVSSTTQGLLPPRMTGVQRDAISSPAAGLMIYNTTTNKLNFYNGTAWEAVTSA